MEKMYCPRCGKPFSGDLSYCRSCGLPLDGVSSVVLGDGSQTGEVKKRPNYSAIRLGVGLFIMGTVLGLAHTVLRDLGLYPDVVGRAVFISFVMAGLASIGFAFLFPKTTYRSSTNSKKPNAADLSLETKELRGQLSNQPESQANLEMPPRDMQDSKVGTVTDQTTQKLELNKE